MKFKYIIVDDEPLARKLIAAHVAKIESLELVTECGDAIEASHVLRTKSVDLIFLDIQMPEINGLKFINTLKNPPSIIITTAFRDYGPEAFELDVIDYLLKPISFERLLKGVNKFFDRTSSSTAKIVDEPRRDQFIYLRSDRKMHKLQVSEIIYIESLDDYVKVHVKGKFLITRESISTLEEKLASSHFVRIHRSFLIAANFVSSIGADGVEISGKMLPFGRTFKHAALANLKIKV